MILAPSWRNNITGGICMKMRYLRYFLVVAEEQSFTRAATRVHIESSPLSRAIRELESDLQVPLFQRTHGRIQLTWAGDVFREEARHILMNVEDARTRVHSAKQGYRGQLRIGLTDHLAQPQFIRLLARCREEEPLTKIRILEMTVNEMIKAMSYDQIDAGFTIHPEPGEGLRKEVVWRDRFAIAIPRNHPLLSLHKIPLREIARYPLLLFHPDSCPGGYDIIHRRLFDSALSSLMIGEYVSGHESTQITLYRHPDVIVRPVADDAPTPATFMVIPDKPPSDDLIHFITRVQQIGQMTSVH
jgi:DNA-binding transcriptional LysR family regulator